MNTNQLKKFAKEARIKLITQIGVKLDFVLTQDTAELRGKSSELAQLRFKLGEQGREQLIETVAYTWFNRLMALRFMDANGYNTPKVVTPLPGMSNPEILQNALAGNVEEDLKLDRQRLNDLIDGRTSSSDPQTEAFKLLLVASCNKWHTAMPFMFERISDYTELLLPDDLLSDFSIVSDIRNGMSDEDCQHEELIGWLYQFYISDKKDDVFEGLKKNIKITAENIPAATQLFTPRWIVRYMVENTLGKLWLTFKPESKLKQHMPYFLEAPEGNNPSQLPEGINSITDITFLDPCQGSGHVLVYAFDLLCKIYEEEGYNTNEIPSLILENNLFGIDIDERAAQLAAFALTMKARGYYTRFLRKPIQPKVIALENINENIIKDAVKLPLAVDGKLIYEHRDLTLYNLTQADNLGSLIQVDPKELNALQIQKGSIWQDQEQKLKKQAEFLSKKYTCVVNNPPYLGQKGMNNDLKKYIEQFYPDSKSDLMACFIERSISFTSKNGLVGMINQQSWMFLSSYETLRNTIVSNFQIETMLHLGTRTFPEIGGEVVQNTSFTISNNASVNKGVFIRLVDFDNSELKSIKTLEAIKDKNSPWLYFSNVKDFTKIPGSPIGYWATEKIKEIFSNEDKLENIGLVRQGASTSNNNRFLRLWHETSIKKIGFTFESLEEAKKTNFKWFPYNKGGSYRKWYGNHDYVINYYNDGQELKEFQSTLSQGWTVRLKSREYYFRPSVSWPKISSGDFSARFYPEGFIFDVAGCCFFPNNPDEAKNIVAFLNSSVANFLLGFLSPTMNYEIEQVKKLPYIKPKNDLTIILNKIYDISIYDWESRENSWNFKYNPLIVLDEKKVVNSINKLAEEQTKLILQLYKLEKELNQNFTNTYGIEENLLKQTTLKEITILQEESSIVNGEISISKNQLVLNLISYAIGCLFGRYSIDKNGLILADCGENLVDFLKIVQNPTFMPDEDNIIPVLAEEWFNDDIVGIFKTFIKTVYSEDFIEENLKYIEEVIENDLRKYFVKDFYNDHIKRYKKRPIYWMFSSPKGHFKALIYMHRYQPDLCSKMLNDYLQPFISKLEAAKQTNTLLSLREDISAREKTLALKEVDRLELMIRDCKDYERTLFTIATQKITIDLDDGVKVNYLKFKDVLVPIKGLEKEED